MFNRSSKAEVDKRRRARYYKMKNAFKIMRACSHQGIIDASGAFNKRRLEANRARMIAEANLLKPNFED